MKDHLAELVGQTTIPGHDRNIVREYLQARILESLQRQGAMVPLAFQGGTALRFLFNLPRYSEDLDFALDGRSEEYELRPWVAAIGAMFASEGYAVDVRVSDAKTVHAASVRFPGLLHAMGASPHAREVLAIKLEVDTLPPAGAGLAVSLVRRHAILRLQHHDRESLLAGKLHAVLQRPFAKGRDLYDLLWYLTAPDWPPPNLVMLNHALSQSRWTGPVLDPGNWRDVVGLRMRQLDWSRVQSDVSPFLERAQELELLTLDNVLRCLAQP